MQLKGHKNNNCQTGPEFLVVETVGTRILDPGFYSLKPFLKSIVFRSLVTLIIFLSIHSPTIKAETVSASASKEAETAKVPAKTEADKGPAEKTETAKGPAAKAEADKGSADKTEATKGPADKAETTKDSTGKTKTTKSPADKTEAPKGPADEAEVVAGEAETAHVPPEQPWSFNGPFGTWDRAALQRGFQVYKEVCSACHGLNHLSYRNLSALGFSENEVKAIAKQYNVKELNDEGELAERPARPSDKFVPPFANEKAARAANNGAYPVDLSMVVSARLYGADYVYSLLTGYHDPPADVEMQPDMHYNLYFPGHQIAMIPPLVENQVAYADGTPATLDQMSRDVATFLHWAAHPQMEARKGMGVMVLIYISIFTVLMYFTMKRIWRRVK